MLKEYEELSINLGSIQYWGIAEAYNGYNNKEKSVNYDKVSKWLAGSNNVLSFKKGIIDFIGILIDGYNKVRQSETYKELTDEECATVGIYDNEGFDDLKNSLDGDLVFGMQLNRKPKQDATVKLFLISWFQRLKDQAWDLWAALSYFENGMGGINLDFEMDESEGLAAIIYIVKVVYDFNDSEIEAMMGDFDT